MIFDRLENFRGYFHGSETIGKAAAFIAGLNENTADGKYAVDGDDIYAIVSSYETRLPEAGVLEAHHKYADVQILISGQETMFVTPTGGSAPEKEYDPAADVEFYCPNMEKMVTVSLKPGVFALLLPEDAHMPNMAPEAGPGRVRKCVLKINTALLK